MTRSFFASRASAILFGLPPSLLAFLVISFPFFSSEGWVELLFHEGPLFLPPLNKPLMLAFSLFSFSPYPPYLIQRLFLPPNSLRRRRRVPPHRNVSRPSIVKQCNPLRQFYSVCRRPPPPPQSGWDQNWTILFHVYSPPLSFDQKETSPLTLPMSLLPNLKTPPRYMLEMALPRRALILFFPQLFLCFSSLI